MPPDEMECAMVRAPEAVFGQDPVGIRGEGPICEKQDFNALTQSVIRQVEELFAARPQTPVGPLRRDIRHLLRSDAGILDKPTELRQPY